MTDRPAFTASIVITNENRRDDLRSAFSILRGTDWRVGNSDN